VRLAVANQCLTRAFGLLHTLEDDVVQLPTDADSATGDVDDGGVMDAIQRHHAATAAAVLASIQQHGQVQVESGPGGSGSAPVLETNRERVDTPMSTEPQTSNPGDGIQSTGISARPE